MAEVHKCSRTRCEKIFVYLETDEVINKAPASNRQTTSSLSHTHKQMQQQKLQLQLIQCAYFVSSRDQSSAHFNKCGVETHCGRMRNYVWRQCVMKGLSMGYIPIQIPKAIPALSPESLGIRTLIFVSDLRSKTCFHLWGFRNEEEQELPKHHNEYRNCCVDMICGAKTSARRHLTPIGTGRLWFNEGDSQTWRCECVWLSFFFCRFTDGEDDKVKQAIQSTLLMCRSIVDGDIPVSVLK